MVIIYLDGLLKGRLKSHKEQGRVNDSSSESLHGFVTLNDACNLLRKMHASRLVSIRRL